MTDPVVYELVDSTNDDQYYTLGLFFSMQEAIDIATSKNYPQTDCAEEYVEMEVRERKIGKLIWWDAGRMVAKIEWVEKWADEGENEENTWTFSITHP